MKEFDENIRIETDHLLLRFLEEGDAKAIFDNINHDKEVLKYYVTDYVEDFENFSLEKMIEAFRQTRKYILAIVLKESGEVIGNILQCNGTNCYMNTVEVGYAIGKKYWNKGYMSEALKAMIDLLFESGVHKVNACHIPENIASSIPYFIKGDLYRDDEPNEASEARNWFEAAIEEILLKKISKANKVKSVYSQTERV